MSWAALARKAAPIEAPADAEPAQRVLATQSETKLEEARLQNLEQHTAITHNLPAHTKGLMVLDTNAFIKGFENYLSAADVFVTTPQVLQECKDRQTKDLLNRLPVGLVVLDPTTDALNKVTDMADKTGDLGTLSRTDIRLCALAYDCCAQINALGAAIQPCGTQVNPDDGIKVNDELQSDSDSDAEGEAAEGEDEDAEAKPTLEPIKDDAAPAATADDDDADSWAEASDAGEPEAKKQKAELPGWGGFGDEDGDGEGEWVTPANINEARAEHEGAQSEFTGGFACATSDFPMQNVLLHLGVPVVGPRGMRIHELRQWLLRCHACYTLVNDTTRLFCPSCGSGDTLKRVAYNINAATGERTLFINFKFHISTRGTRYTLPRPRGGRNGTNRRLVLREDQLLHCGRNTAHQKRRIVADEDLAGFGDDKQKHVRRDPGQQRVSSSYHKYNVNEKRKVRASRRK